MLPTAPSSIGCGGGTLLGVAVAHAREFVSIVGSSTSAFACLISIRPAWSTSDPTFTRKQTQVVFGWVGLGCARSRTYTARPATKPSWIVVGFVQASDTPAPL